MARMYPELLSPEVLADRKRSAEVKVYEALRGLPNEYVVFYGLRWLAKQGTQLQDKEADFVVFHPDKGMLCLEVKGGRIGVRDAQWFSIDRHNQEHAIHNPLEQAMECKKTLLRKIKQLPGLGNIRFGCGHAVVFPDAAPSGKPLGLDAPNEIILFRDDLERIEQKIREIFAYFLEVKQTPLKAYLGKIITCLAPNIVLKRPPLGDFVRADEELIVQLTQQQYEIARELDRESKLIVTGGAGTGKTLIAFEHARRRAGQGYKTLFTCFNKLLADHLKKVVDDPNLTVLNYHQICFKLGCEAAFNLTDPDGPEQYKMDRAYFEQYLAEILLKSLEQLPQHRYDCIIVDEGQDFLDEWWVTLELLHSDFQNGPFYVFCDNSQDLWRASSGLPFTFPQQGLNANLRNTKSIYRNFKRFYKGSMLSNFGPEGRPVEYVATVPGNPLIQLLEKTVNRLIHEEKIAARDIAILTGESSKKSILANQRQIAGLELDKGISADNKKICFSSIRRFKGLEKPVVILIEIDRLMDSTMLKESLTECYSCDQRQIRDVDKLKNDLLYVGMSRARSHLIIFGTEDTVKFLNTVDGINGGIV